MASSTVDKFGNSLGFPQVQSGWQVEADGFGLLQAQVKFKWDIAYRGNFVDTFHRGLALGSVVPGVGSPYSNMGLWKANMTTDKNNVITVTADFCGIDPGYNSGVKTETQVAMTGSTAAEPIEHHPNFLTLNCPTSGLNRVLAGFPPASGWDPEVSSNPNRALWTPKVANNGATQGQQFVGFLPNQNAAELSPYYINIKAGIKNYYKPTATLRCLFYVDNETTAVAYASYVGWSTNGNLYGLPEAYKGLATGSYGGSFIYSQEWSNQIHRGFLVTNCSVERFGNIWKVTADLMMSGISGWDKDIYPSIDGY